MSKSQNQKLKLIYLMEILWEKTDAKHVVSMKEILEYMESRGIHAERKSIYDDIDALRLAGWDIRNRRERPAGYYLNSREWDLQDLHLMVRILQSSRLLTARKSREFIEKFKKMYSSWESELVKGTIYVQDRIKAMNESIFPKIEDIEQAISENVQITFRYMDQQTGKDFNLKEQIQSCQVSPWAIIYTDTYYCIACIGQQIKRYCIQDMSYIRQTAIEREGKDIFEKNKFF